MADTPLSSNLVADAAVLARAIRVCDDAGDYDAAEHVNRAAIQIERLTAERDAAHKLAHAECVMRFESYAERDRLRAELENIANGRVGDQIMMRPDLYAKAQLAGAADETSAVRESVFYMQCEKHRLIPYSFTVTSVMAPVKTVCPICHPPEQV